MQAPLQQPIPDRQRGLLYATFNDEMNRGIPRQSWFRQNWKWVLGVPLAAGVLGAAMAFFFIRNSDATKLALATATSNAALIERLGQPIQSGWFIEGSIHLSSESGEAELAIPVSGPKGKGTVYALAAKTKGTWKLTLLQFSADNESSRIELLEPLPIERAGLQVPWGKAFHRLGLPGQ